MSKITWRRRGKTHTGHVIGGTVANDREVQMRLRTYYVGNGDSMVGTGEELAFLKTKYYVRSRDDGDGQGNLSVPRLATDRAFPTLDAAQKWCQQDLSTRLPKTRWFFVGRDKNGQLVWSDKADSEKVGMTRNVTTPADEFYAEMTRS